jgi:hypothetical protein
MDASLRPERWESRSILLFIRGHSIKSQTGRSCVSLMISLRCFSSPGNPSACQKTNTIKALQHSRIPRVQRSSSSLPLPLLNCTLYETLEPVLSSLMSDIEKHESPQRRCQVGNPAPLFVAFHWHIYWCCTENSLAVVDCLVLHRQRSSSPFTTYRRDTLPFQMSWSVWPCSMVDWPSSLQACGSLSQVTRSVQLVSIEGNFQLSILGSFRVDALMVSWSTIRVNVPHVICSVESHIVLLRSTPFYPTFCHSTEAE